MLSLEYSQLILWVPRNRTGMIGQHCNWGKIDIPNGGVPDEA